MGRPSTHLNHIKPPTSQNVTENPYESPTATDAPSDDGPRPKLGIGAWLFVAIEAISVFVVLFVLAGLATAWIWPITPNPNPTAGDKLPRWLIPYYFVTAMLVAAPLAWYQAAYHLRKCRTRAARKADIDRQRREAIESARQRHS